MGAYIKEGVINSHKHTK